ncbi:phosphoribosyltransferase domain-containing protein [Methylobacter marinus]|uniref:phosphoribosyltransferase domain-containing protein n=1 Tax=Methylobacter marinus TaxID=34058 RepID=UPI00036BDE37|nr:phosphoribosyltransferase domain-containing protein [Methylobacter marinus]
MTRAFAHAADGVQANAATGATPADSAGAARHRLVELRTGELHITTEPGRVPLHRLLGFASRINSKRGFLLVSKVLGKHYPVSPRTMAWSYRALARSLSAGNDFSAPSLWVGMAETATGLGYGVFEAAYALGVRDALFMQTTRYHLAGGDRLEFTEDHSHATDFFLYYPGHEKDRTKFLGARQLVLIDDEISTGATFARLIAAYRAVNPRLEKVIIVSLVNFASPEHRHRLEASAGIPVQWVNLLAGQLRFEPVDTNPEQFRDQTINVAGNGLCKRDLLAWPGRLGMGRPVRFSDLNIAGLLAFLPDGADSRPILVLGTGECNPPAYLLGRSLERLGYRVTVQATTRSPIFPEGAIKSRLRFTDNYQDDIDNFLYNVNPGDFRLIVFCHETPLVPGNTPDGLDFVGLIKQLNAVSARFSCQDNNNNAEFHFYRP